MACILVVDDDPDIGNLIQEVLSSRGHRILRAYSGTEALLLLRTNEAPPDLVLLDLMLPGADGSEVLRHCTGIRVIVVSAKGETQDKVSLLRAGASDYITKPFSIDELCARVDVQLRQPAPPGSSRLRCGTISYDQDSRISYVNGKPVRLTPTEDALLRVFLLHPKQILTRSALLDMLMSLSEDCTEQSLKQHIFNLRKKLREAGSEEQIESIRGIGFRLKSPSPESVKKS